MKNKKNYLVLFVVLFLGHGVFADDPASCLEQLKVNKSSTGYKIYNGNTAEIDKVLKNMKLKQTETTRKDILHLIKKYPGILCFPSHISNEKIEGFRYCRILSDGTPTDVNYLDIQQESSGKIFCHNRGKKIELTGLEFNKGILFGIKPFNRPSNPGKNFCTGIIQSFPQCSPLEGWLHPKREDKSYPNVVANNLKKLIEVLYEINIDNQVQAAHKTLYIPSMRRLPEIELAGDSICDRSLALDNAINTGNEKAVQNESNEKILHDELLKEKKIAEKNNKAKDNVKKIVQHYLGKDFKTDDFNPEQEKVSSYVARVLAANELFSKKHNVKISDLKQEDFFGPKGEKFFFDLEIIKADQSRSSFYHNEGEIYYGDGQHACYYRDLEKFINDPKNKGEEVIYISNNDDRIDLFSKTKEAENSLAFAFNITGIMIEAKIWDPKTIDPVDTSIEAQNKIFNQMKHVCDEQKRLSDGDPKRCFGYFLEKINEHRVNLVKFIREHKDYKDSEKEKIYSVVSTWLSHLEKKLREAR